MQWPCTIGRHEGEGDLFKKGSTESSGKQLSGIAFGLVVEFPGSRRVPLERKGEMK